MLYPCPFLPLFSCTCVPYYQCEDGKIITDGSGIIRPRNRDTPREETSLVNIEIAEVGLKCWHFLFIDTVR